MRPWWCLKGHLTIRNPISSISAHFLIWFHRWQQFPVRQLRFTAEWTDKGSSFILFSFPSRPVRWWPASTQRSSSQWSIRKSTWPTTCWPGSTSASGSAGCQPSPCPIYPPTAWRGDPASWTCGQCPPPLAMERESPLLGGFITASFWINKKVVHGSTQTCSIPRYLTHLI